MTRDRLAIKVLARRDVHLAGAESKLAVLHDQLSLRLEREILTSDAAPALRAELDEVRNWIVLIRRGIEVQEKAIEIARAAAWRRACVALGIAEAEPKPMAQ